MNHKVYTALIVAALGLGIYIGKSYFSKTQTVEVEKEVQKSDVVTVVHEIVKPDGSKETTSTTTDKSVTNKDAKSSIVSVAPPPPNWHVSASYAVEPLSGSYQPIYGLQVERRILGPFSVGVRAQSDKQIGVVVSYEF